VVPVFEEIARQNKGSVLIVAHAGVNRVILCHVLGMPLANLFRLDQDYGALNMIDCKEKQMRVKAINVRPAWTI
jgi:probable phosphoglycerate mutase